MTDMTSQETTPIRKSAFWEQKGNGNGQISRANFEEKKGRSKKYFVFSTS